MSLTRSPLRRASNGRILTRSKPAGLPRTLTCWWRRRDGLGVVLAVLMRCAGALKVEGGTPPPPPAADEHNPAGGERPPVVLRERLAAARQAGASFDEAWPDALVVR
jgi:hypothetical protein